MKKRIKVRQRDVTDCGAACLASVAAFYKLRLPVSRIRQYAGTDKTGTNVLGLIEAAERLGFQSKGAKGKIEHLPKIPLPAIAHVILKNGLHHYVVLYKVTDKQIVFMDPADGAVYKEQTSIFKDKWSGVVILLLPAETFNKGNETVSNQMRFWELIKPHSGIMFQALTGAIVYTILGLASSIYMQKIIDFVLPDGNLKLLNLLSCLMMLTIILQAFIGIFKTKLGLRTGQMIDARLILGYYKHLLQLPQSFFDSMRAGEIISRVNDAVKIRVFINEVALNLIVNGLTVLFSIGVMFLYYWKLALILLVIIPVYMALYWLNNRLNKRWSRTLMEQAAELEGQLVESLNSIGTIKKFGLEEYANTKTENRFIRLLRSIYKSSIYGIYTASSADFVTKFFTTIILWTGSYFVIHRALSPGELLSFYALTAYLTSPAVSLIAANKNIQDALIAADRLFEIIDLEKERSDQNMIDLTPSLMGDISFNAISFRYGTRAMVFNELSLKIKKGAITGIVGESGSGKSTILALLQNLYPLKAGSIFIGSIDVKHIENTSLRKTIAVVPQEIDLFAGTIIENIAIGTIEPDFLRIVFLCQLLGINEFIEQLPANYHSFLNEQGINLSGGQRQRLAIARALYREPEVLILDEATANLDPISEIKVQETIDWFNKQGKTIIIIAHRLTSVRNCDNILVLQKGKLLEQGSHAELLSLNGLYRSYWNNLGS